MKVAKDICPACGKKEALALEKIDLESQHRHYAPDNRSAQESLTIAAKSSAEKYTMHKCVSCALEYAEPCIAPSNSWYSLAYSLLDLYPAKRWEFDYVINNIGVKDLVGEIGCGSGSFLKKCQAKNINCHGVDFSVDAINQCLKDNLPASLLDVVKTSFRQDEKKTVIVSFHVLEHLDNPSQLFKLASEWSTYNATLWIAIPSNLRPTRILNEADYLDQPPHHLTRWTPQALTEIGQLNGWKLTEIIYEPINLSTSLWWYSTRSSIYQRIQKTSLFKYTWIERVLRYANYPSAMLKRFTAKNKMTGFTLLAKYSK